MSANSHYADAASRIYLQQADSAARAAEQRGQIWGQALTNIGKVGGQAVTQIQADRREGQIAAIFKQYGNDFDKALPEVYKIDPVLGHKIAKQVFEQKTWAHELQDLQWKTDGRTLLTLREKLANVTDQVGWSAYLAAAQQAGQNVSGYPPDFDPAAVAQLGQKLEKAWQMHQGAAPVKPEFGERDPTKDLYNKATGQVTIKGVPAPDKPPQPSYDQWVQEQLLKEQEAAAGTPAAAAPSAVTPTAPASPASIALPAEGEGASVAPAPMPAAGAPAAGAPPKAPMTPAQIRVEAVRRAKEKTEEAKHSPAYVEWQDYKANGGTLGFDAYMTRDANRRAVQLRVNTGQATEDDIDDVITGMKDGTLPPVLPGRASPALTKLMAAAQRRGFDLAGAATDWQATQKHIATMNGAQQLRLNQAVNALPEMLDKVDDLAKQWKAGSFPLLNRANLALAKGGAFGTKAAEIANQLDAQIADVVADLGNVYMGGNSPTDHALSLAAKSLQADWSEPVLRKMVGLAKTNVQIRRNSINNTGVAGASADNPYMPPPPKEPPAAAGYKEGDVRPIAGFPGAEQTYRNGGWVRTK